MDRCYRYVWSDRNGEPLRQMEERGVNMQDVRNRLGVKSVRWKVEKRVLERIGHVVRMGNERCTKALVFGWWEQLEGTEKMKGKKKKTVLYWKRLMREAGWDWTDVERLANDRKEWKRMVNERMKHLHEWECQRAHRYEWEEEEERLVRDVVAEENLSCMYEGCEMVCWSKAALTVHQKRMHRLNEERVRFECRRCMLVLETEGARTNHERRCVGDVVLEDGRVECGRCRRALSRANMSRHRRACERRMRDADDENGNQVEEEGARDREANEGEREVEGLVVEGLVVEGPGNQGREAGREIAREVEEEEEDWFVGFEEEEMRRGNRLRNREPEEEENGFEGFEGVFVRAQGGENEIERGMEQEAEEVEIGAAARGREGGRVFLGRRAPCRICGLMVSYSNRARHERGHRIWDPGGGLPPA